MWCPAGQLQRESTNANTAPATADGNAVSNMVPRQTQRQRTNTSWPGNFKQAQLTNVVPGWATQSTGMHQSCDKHGHGNSKRNRRYKYGAPANSTGTHQAGLANGYTVTTSDHHIKMPLRQQCICSSNTADM